MISKNISEITFEKGTSAQTIFRFLQNIRTSSTIGFLDKLSEFGLKIEDEQPLKEFTSPLLYSFPTRKSWNLQPLIFLVAIASGMVTSTYVYVKASKNPYYSYHVDPGEDCHKQSEFRSSRNLEWSGTCGDGFTKDEALLYGIVGFIVGGVLMTSIAYLLDKEEKF